MKMPIYILGFMSSGKSSLGKRLAKKLELQFIDLDQEIEKREGKTINQLFEEFGESEFRKIESEVLKSTHEKSAVVALGGGTPCSPDNMKFIKQHGSSIYLKVRAEILTGRLRAGKAKRPLVKDLSDKEIGELVMQKLQEREGFYSQADWILEKDNPSVIELMALMEKQPS